MKKNTQVKWQKRVLATKKLAGTSTVKVSTPLKFRQLSDSELSAKRNSAYAYIVR